MAYYDIERYRARWNYDSHYGDFNIGYRRGGSMQWKTIRVEDPDEFSAVIDLLRNEKPVWYHEGGHFLQTTHSEFIGEGEDGQGDAGVRRGRIRCRICSRMGRRRPLHWGRMLLFTNPNAPCFRPT